MNNFKISDDIGHIIVLKNGGIIKSLPLSKELEDLCNTIYELDLSFKSKYNICKCQSEKSNLKFEHFQFQNKTEKEIESTVDFQIPIVINFDTIKKIWTKILKKILPGR